MINNLSNLTFTVIIAIVLFAIPQTANSQKPAAKTAVAQTLPDLPAPSRSLKNVLSYRVKLKTDEASDVWIYVPEKATQEKLPVILTSAPGSYLFNGAALKEGMQTIHLPYVNKGFIVVAYETPGDLGETDLSAATEKQLTAAAIAFKNSRAGLTYQKAALDYAIAKVPTVDASKIFAVGTSSAATHALLVAANDSRIKGVVAFAPATDLEKRLAIPTDALGTKIPGYKAFIKSISPRTNIAKIKCPALIFQAKDDEALPLGETQEFVSELQAVNSNVTFVTAETGGHFNAMVREGVPRAIIWLYNLAF